MTEQEWLACADPHPMLELLSNKASDRKLRLLGLAPKSGSLEPIEQRPFAADRRDQVWILQSVAPKS